MNESSSGKWIEMPVWGSISVHTYNLYNGMFMLCSESIFLEWFGCSFMPQILALYKVQVMFLGFFLNKQSWKNVIKISMALDDKDTFFHCLVFVRHSLQGKITEKFCWRGDLTVLKWALVGTVLVLWSHWNVPCTVNQLCVLSTHQWPNIYRTRQHFQNRNEARVRGWDFNICWTGSRWELVAVWRSQGIPHLWLRACTSRVGFISRVPCRPYLKFELISAFSDLR